MISPLELRHGAWGNSDPGLWAGVLAAWGFTLHLFDSPDMGQTLFGAQGHRAWQPLRREEEGESHCFVRRLAWQPYCFMYKAHVAFLI